jgi:arabinogalactan endo-1,4-beta-galactosidase
MIVETAYPARAVKEAPAAAKNMIWPMTPEGQKQFLADVIKTVKEAPEGHGIGVNYWRPEETYIPNATGGRGGPDANSLFDAKGNPLPAMNVLGLQPTQPLAQAMPASIKPVGQK